MQTLPPLAGTQWYVAAENLLAYMTDPALREMTPVADQTLWSITAAADARFQGTAETRLWIRTPDGAFRQFASTSNAMDGTVTETGEVTIVFTPDSADQATTTGYGWMRMVDGVWRMEMQMATGAQSLALHWAYMTPWTGDAMPSDVPPRALEGSLRSDEWRRLRGTAWTAMDEALFPDGATFTVDGYRNGYLWGQGATTEGSALRMAGSVTPEGSLYLLFSLDDAPAVARRGTLAADGGARMTWSAPAGGPPEGSARLRA